MNAETMRQNSRSCLALAQSAANEPAKKRFLRMADAWKTLADNKDWLDGAIVPGMPFNQVGTRRLQRWWSNDVRDGYYLLLYLASGAALAATGWMMFFPVHAPLVEQC